ncbi:MAG: hypothetical protein KTQ12_00550 [Dermatophilaceae bacterium]|nr:hypothetical protein [Dermatophilaceae bacterium]
MDGTLRYAWTTLMGNAGCLPTATPLAETVGDELLARWSEPARHYHTTRHLAEVLDALRDLNAQHPLTDTDRLVTELAAWFHDAIYDSRSPDNEERSADLATEHLSALHLNEEVVAEVSALVRATASHNDMTSTAAGRAFHDADLWILGAPPDRFDQYCRQVRDEYAWVPDADYAAGRAAVLMPFAASDRLYLTPSASRWESAARANLARELARVQP